MQKKLDPREAQLLHERSEKQLEPEQQDPVMARARVERVIKRYIEHSPYLLNPDVVTVEHVMRGLARNLAEHGRWYCPCREVTGDPAKDRENICPCTFHKQEIEAYGACECGLFVSEKYVIAHTAVAQLKKEKKEG